MKKVILTSLVCVAALGLAACTGSNQKANTSTSSKTSSTASQSTSSSSSSSSKEDKKKQEETRKKYQEVLDRGARLESERAKNDTDGYVQYLDSQLDKGNDENHMWYHHAYSGTNFQYAFYDIDHDGTDELLIGDSTSISGIFSLVDGKPEFQLAGIIATVGGSRTALKLLQDGTIVYSYWQSIDPDMTVRAYKLSSGKVEKVGNEATVQLNTDQTAEASLGLTSPAVDLTKLTWENFPEVSTSASSSQETSQASATTSLSSVDETEIRNTIKNGLGLATNFGPNPQVLLDITNDHAGIRSYKMSEMLDYYNTYNPEIYQRDDVLADLKAKSLDIPFANRSEDELLDITKEADTAWSWLYSTQDDVLFLVQKGGGGGSGPSMDIPPVSEWTVDGDTVTVPTTIEGSTTPYRTYIFKRNNKQYSGGTQKSRFYMYSNGYN